MRRAALLLLVVTTTPAFAGNWPAWRGPGGQGVCVETDLPLHWGRDSNVRWKAPLPDRGNSTPIVWEERVFLTQATDRDKGRSTLCFDRRNGRQLWQRKVVHEKPEPTHQTNPYCSASPVTDGERVIVSYGSAGVHCYGLDGEEQWQRDLGEFRHIWGNAASPVIHGDLCFVNCGPGPRTFLAALDKRSGKTIWKNDIPGGREGGDSKTWTGSWSTPLVGAAGEREALLISYPGWLLALEPASGKEIWKCAGLGNLVYTSPLAAAGVVVAMSGFQGPPLAVRAGGSGDVTDTRRLWRHERGPQRIGSGVVDEGRIYIVNDNGTAECIELESGKRLWQDRLGSQCWSSLLLSDDKLYSIDRDGTCFVFRAAARFELLARNELDEPTRASVAASNGELFIRTYKHLWCIGKP